MRIEVYVEGDTITFIPYITGKTRHHFIQAEPFHKQRSLDEDSVGGKVLEIKRQIETMEKDQETERKSNEKAVLKEIGYKSWKKVKERTVLIVLYTRQEENGEEIIHIGPRYPIGRGYQYIGCEEDERTQVKVDEPGAIGAAVTDRINYLQGNRNKPG